MKIVTPFAWLGSAALVFLLALGAHNEGIAIASVFMAGIGTGTLFPALKERWSKPHMIAPPDDRIERLEQRLRQTEDELASTSKHLDRLKDERDFDLQLRLKNVEMEKR